MHTGVLLLASYTTLQLGLYQHFGFYTPLALAFVSMSFLFLIGAGMLFARTGRTTDSSGTWKNGVLCLFLVLGMFQLPGIYLHSQQYAVLFFYCWILVLLLSLFTFLPLAHQSRIHAVICFVGIFIAMLFRWYMPFASPHPIIDLYVMMQESAQHFLAGMNPYTTPFFEKIGVLHTWNLGYYYLPGSLYVHTIGFLIFGDVRYVHILAELLFSLILWSLSSRRVSARSAQLLVLLFLFQPKGLFFVEQAFSEPLLLASLGVSLMLMEQGKPFMAAAMYGYFLSLKQYLLYFALHGFMLEKRMRFILVTIGVLVVTFLPFLWMDAFGFWKAISFHLQVGIAMRANSLSLFTPFYRSFGWAPDAGTGMVIGAIASIGTLLLFWRKQTIVSFLFSSTITTFAMFLFGGIATPNYYYFVGGLMLLLIAVQGEKKLSGKQQSIAASFFPIPLKRKVSLPPPELHIFRTIRSLKHRL